MLKIFGKLGKLFEKKVIVTNHYGHWVSSEDPITGVTYCNKPEFLNEEINNALDLDYEDYMENNPENLDEEELENMEWDSSTSTYLVGSWKKDSDGKYTEDTSGEYAAIVNENTCQVVWSKYT